MPGSFAPRSPRWPALLAGAQAQAADLTVSAAASLTNAFKEIGTAFEAANPDTKVQFNFGASGALLQQIAKGAPVDVFASADQETMQQAEQQQLVRPGAQAQLRLQLAGRGRSRSDATARAQDLGRPRQAPAVKKVAIGMPASVPVGRYTKAVLEKAQLWSAIEPKMIGAQTVRQALDYVARGEVDAGFVYATDAAIMPDKVKVAFVVPTRHAGGLSDRRRWRRARIRPRRRSSSTFVLSPAGAGACSPSTASASPERRPWRRLGRSRPDAEGRRLGDGIEPGARRRRRLRAGPLALPGPRTGRLRILLAADGAAADRARLLPAGASSAGAGWLGGWLERTFGINLIFTWQGAVIAATIVAFPLVCKSARAAFENVDPQLEQAAQRARARRGRGRSSA